MRKNRGDFGNMIYAEPLIFYSMVDIIQLYLVELFYNSRGSKHPLIRVNLG